MKHGFKAAFFDMDGVLLKEITWQVVHDYVGVSNAENVKAYEANDIDYRKFMVRDVELWDDLSIQELEKALCHLQPRPGSEKLIKRMREKGYEKIVIVSGGINLAAEKLAHQFHLDDYFTNDFKTEEKNGKEIITGPKMNFDLSKKGEIVRNLSKKFGIPLEKTIAIGDSRFDIGMLKATGKGIAFDPKDEKVKNAADVVVDSENIIDLTEHI